MSGISLISILILSSGKKQRERAQVRKCTRGVGGSARLDLGGRPSMAPNEEGKKSV